MKIREALLLGIAIAIICVVLVIVAFLFCITGLADDVQMALPEPEYVHPDEIIMQRGVAPELNRLGFNNYETFDEALELVKSSIPGELVELAGHAIWGEAGNVRSTARQAAVLWIACNRVDAWGKTFDEVLVGSQFNGLWQERPVPESFEALARDVLARWVLEREGWLNVGRTIAPEYLYFYGDGNENIFTVQMHRGIAWDWNLADPYDGEMGAEISF